MPLEIAQGDLKINKNSTFAVAQGDLVITNDNDQHLLLHCDSSFGNFINAPTIGANLSSFLNSPLSDTNNIVQAVANSLYLDGFILEETDISTNNLNEIDINIVEAEKVTDDTDNLI